MKVLNHIVLIFSLIAGVAKTVSSYYMNMDYIWPLIASIWILSCYSGFLLNASLQKRLEQYEK